MLRFLQQSLLTTLCTGAIFTQQLAAQPVHQLTVSVNKPIAEVSPSMWGVFFEDINFAADGGLYAELVKNRSFEFAVPMMGWKEVRQDGGAGSILIINNKDSFAANPRFASIDINSDKGSYGLVNDGFRGIGIHKDETYNFSLFAKKATAADIKILVELLDARNAVIGKTSISGLNNNWTKLSGKLTATASEPKAKLRVTFQGKGNVAADMISLFPQHTWKERPNGLRADLVQMLYDMKPGFVRFPGGCIVEGRDLINRYQWKKTVGKTEERELMINRWNTEFSYRSAPDYFQSFGLGFFEYFQLCDDIGAEPLPILNCGMACQYNTGEVVAMNQLDPFVQDALDLIEFANGSITTTWGKLRADMGHPAPFNLKLLGIGNEQWDEQYVERYAVFEKTLQEKHPEVKLIASSGPSPDGSKFDYLWKTLKTMKPDFVDEHYYKSPEWFFANASRYDRYDRKGPKVFAGEYAAHSKEDKESESRNTWISALAEAAFMTGLERNAAVVQLASYAPLLAHVEAWQWRPDLIWFDNLRTVGTPNYYVQKLFATNKGTTVIPVLENGNILAGKDSLYASAVTDRKTNEIILKLVNASPEPVTIKLNVSGAGLVKGKLVQTTITAAKDLDYNTLDKPGTVLPVEKITDFKGVLPAFTFAGHSVNMIRVPLKK